MARELGSRPSLWQARPRGKINVALDRGLSDLARVIAAVCPERNRRVEHETTSSGRHPIPRRLRAGAFTTNNIDMSSTESSGAPAEAPATNPAPDAAFPTFGTTRGSGLARGKRPSTSPAAATASTPSDYKPTAIEVVHAPREYTNPFAPVNPEPAVSVESPAPVPQPTPVARVTETPPPAASIEPSPTAVQETPAELNILPPAEQKTATAQTWESEGFRPARAERSERPERPRREERPEAPADEPVDISSIPEKFLYVRPGVTFVPTPRNWGGAPRERRTHDESAPRSFESPRATEAAPVATAAPEKSGGFLGWLKSLFGGSPAPSESAPTSASAATGEPRREGGGQRRHRGGRNRGGQGGGGGSGSHRGGRGRSGGYRGERSEGTRSGGSL
jgi:uncharacterized membrane protein YgcG